MKARTVLPFALCMYLLGTLLANESGTGQPVEAFSFRPLRLREGIAPEDYEKSVRSIESHEGVIPGVTFLDVKADRGRNKGTYAHLWVYDSVKVRDFYFPEEDGEDSLWSFWLQASDGLLAREMKKRQKYVSPLTPGIRATYTNYVAIKSATNVRFVDLVAKDPATTAFSLRPLTLKEGVQPEAFEEFVKRLPSLEGLVPGVEFLLLKGDRGVNKGQFIMLWVYDSVKVRDFYFPSEDGENPLWQAWLRASDGLLQRVLHEASEYIVFPDSSTQGDFTCYVGIP